LNAEYVFELLLSSYLESNAQNGGFFLTPSRAAGKAKANLHFLALGFLGFFEDCVDLA
jgi:hypothetical protein